MGYLNLEHPITPDWLRRWRDARGWTQYQAAEWAAWRAPFARLSVETWRKYEQGRRRIPVWLVRLVADE